MKMNHCLKLLSASVFAAGSLLSPTANANHGQIDDQRCPDLSLAYINDSRVAVVVDAPSKEIASARTCLNGECINGVRNKRYFVSEFDARLGEYYTITVETEHKGGHKKYKEHTLRFTQNNCLDYWVASAPSSTAGMDVVLTITNTESEIPEGYPTMGAVVQSYSDGGIYHYQGFGGDYHLTGSGTYDYQRTGVATAKESAVQSSDAFTLPYTMEYTFETDTSGRWIQHFAGGVIVFSGTFTISHTGAAPYAQYAPETVAGYTLLLQNHEDPRDIALRDYREQGMYHSYEGLTMDFTAGEYDYTKLASGSAVEEYASNELTLEEGFVRVYTFATPVRGTWYEKSRDGETEKTGSFWVLGRE